MSWEAWPCSIHTRSFSSAQPTTICGRPATRQEATIAADPFVMGGTDPAGGSGHSDQESTAETQVVAFTAANQEILLSRSGPSALRDTRQTGEESFFRALVCR